MSGSVTLATLAWPVADVSARLTAHDAVICTASLLADDRRVAMALAVLAPEERKRYESYTNAVVARRFAMGRALLREIVGCALGAPPERVPLREGLHGKPALARGGSVRPLWFSVAHCEDLLLVALSRHAEVGVDLERARSIEQWERVADRVLAPAERAQLRRSVDAGEDAGTAFLRHWCRVEAELKAIGCGIVGLEDHRAGRKPLGLRVTDLANLPLPAAVTATGARYQAALALCSPGVDSARQITLPIPQAATPTITPRRASTA
jgi:phosphopantetheinyl transferase